MHQGNGPLNYCSIRSFRYSILLGCVGDSGLMVDTEFVEVLLERVTCILATIVRSDNFTLCSVSRSTLVNHCLDNFGASDFARRKETQVYLE